MQNETKVEKIKIETNEDQHILPEKQCNNLEAVNQVYVKVENFESSEDCSPSFENEYKNKIVVKKEPDLEEVVVQCDPVDVLNEDEDTFVEAKQIKRLEYDANQCVSQENPTDVKNNSLHYEKASLNTAFLNPNEQGKILFLHYFSHKNCLKHDSKFILPNLS